MFDLLKQLKKIKRDLPRLLRKGKMMDKTTPDFKNQAIPFPEVELTSLS